MQESLNTSFANPAAGAAAPAGGARLVWCDVVRLLAMFTVVMCHSADPFNFCPDPDMPGLADVQWWGAVYGSVLRPCVPLFVMLTGALLLPVRREPSDFYRRRIPRVLWPFLLWSVVYALFPWVVGLLGFAPDAMLTFFPYSGADATQLSLGTSLGYIVRIPLNFSPIAVHMWYIYLLIGLYLYLPVFSAWVERASARAQRWFLAAWGVTLFVPYLREFAGPYIWGACSWNEFSALYYFAGFNGYLLLGHYLRHHLPGLRRTLLFGIPAFVVAVVVTFMGFRHMTAQPGCTPEQLELFFYYCSPNVVLMTAPLFILCAHVRVRSRRLQSLLANLTTCGFGIYMVHFFLTGPSILLMRTLAVPLPLQIPLGAVVAFAATWLLVELLRRLTGRASRYVIG